MCPERVGPFVVESEHHLKGERGEGEEGERCGMEEGGGEERVS